MIKQNLISYLLNTVSPALCFQFANIIYSSPELYGLGTIISPF